MEFYHLINRGVDKRKVFEEDGDYIRFIHDMYVFNDTQSAPNSAVKARAAHESVICWSIYMRSLLCQITTIFWSLPYKMEHCLFYAKTQYGLRKVF